MRGWRRGLLGLTAAGLVLAACGGSGYEYVSDDDAGLYFRVPEDWTVIEVDDPGEGMPETIGPGDSWVRLIDRSPQPGAANLQASLPAYPVGMASVVPVESSTARDELDLATLRSYALDGEDPLVLANQDDSGLELVDGYDVTTDEGFRGQRVVFTMEVEGGRFVTIDHTALVNSETTDIYRLLLKCESHCYEDNRDEIDDIVDSWTIEQES